MTLHARIVKESTFSVNVVDLTEYRIKRDQLNVDPPFNSRQVFSAKKSPLTDAQRVKRVQSKNNNYRR